ncbi:hypothetical protein COD11_06810 [Bacillus sp. AFS040349]|nr:hypothetical protein COD11_06810 [Bacillus sp. AFS040349]
MDKIEDKLLIIEDKRTWQQILMSFHLNPLPENAIEMSNQVIFSWRICSILGSLMKLGVLS